MSYLRFTRIYWLSGKGLCLDLIANAMPARYDQILRDQILHFVDNYSNDLRNTDKLFKIIPVLDTFQKTYCAAVDTEEFQSVDEQIIPFKGHLSIKHYNSKKPKPWGLKVWVRASSSGYMYRFEVYQGLAGCSQVRSHSGCITQFILSIPGTDSGGSGSGKFFHLTFPHIYQSLVMSLQKRQLIQLSDYFQGLVSGLVHKNQPAMRNSIYLGLELMTLV